MSIFSFSCWLWACIVCCLTYVHAQDSSDSVMLVNNCGFGNPSLVQLQQPVLANGSTTFTNTTVAFLNAGSCGPNGENCTAVNINMDSGISSASFMGNGFNVAVSFTFFGGCTGGSQCLNEGCGDQSVNCLVSGTSVLVNFCLTLSSSMPPSSSSLVPTSSKSCSSSPLATTTLPPPSATLPSPVIPSQSVILSSAIKAQTGLNRSQIGAIAGGVIGGITFLVILFCLFWLWRRKRTREARTPLMYVVNPTWATPRTSAISDQQPESPIPTNMTTPRPRVDPSFWIDS